MSWTYIPGQDGSGPLWFNDQTGQLTGVQPMFDFGNGMSAPGMVAQAGQAMVDTTPMVQYGPARNDGMVSREVYGPTGWETAVTDGGAWLTNQSANPGAAPFLQKAEEEKDPMGAMLAMLAAGGFTAGAIGASGLGGAGAAGAGGFEGASGIGEMVGGGYGAGSAAGVSPAAWGGGGTGMFGTEGGMGLEPWMTDTAGAGAGFNTGAGAGVPGVTGSGGGGGSLLSQLRSAPGLLQAIGSALGIASGVGSLGGGSGSGTGSSLYVPTGQGSADQLWQKILQQMYGNVAGAAGLVGPTINSAYQNTLGIDTQPLVQAGQQAGQQYSDLASLARQYGGMLGDQAQQQFGAGRDIYNLARDPQSALRDRLQQRTVENSRAAGSARGLAMSPYSAGMENDATRDFNLNWEDRLLDRANTGLSAMGRANQMGAADLTGALQFGQMSPEFTMQSAQAPIAGQQAAAQFPAEAAMRYMQQMLGTQVSPYAGIQSQIMPYLGHGATSGAYAANAGMAQADQQNRFQTQGLERILGGLQNLMPQQQQQPRQQQGPGGWLTNLWGSNSSGGGGGTYGAYGDAGYYG